MNIGEFFVKLGFKVDDKGLRVFDQGLRDATRSALQLAGVTLSVAGFKNLLDGSAKSAVALDNLALKFGQATDRAQRFMNAMQRSNPNATRESSFAAYQNIANYAGLLPINGAGRGAVFGITAADDSPEKVIEKLRENYERVSSMYGKAYAAEIAREITGTDDALNALLLTRQQYQAAASDALISQEDIQAMRDYAAATQELNVQFEAWKGHSFGQAIRNVKDFFKEANQKGTWTALKDRIHGLATDIGAWETSKGIGIDRLGAVAHPLQYNQKIADYMKQGMTRDEAARRASADLAYKAPPPPPPPPVPTGADRQATARNFFKMMGWSENQAAGMVRRLAAESGQNLNHFAVGDGGKAFGIGQWHPDRQADFEAWAGKSIRNSSFQDQLGFVNYELTQGKERRAGNLLKRTQSEAEAYGIFTNEYERPAAQHRAPMSVTQHIYGGGDAQSVGRESARQTMQAYQQMNIGAQY